MKTIVVREWGGPEVLTFEEAPDPKPGPGEVLIRLKAIGVNPVETYMRSGVYAHLPELPCILGGDAAGAVEELGEGVSEFEIGQRVYVAGAVGGRMTGCYAELVTRAAGEVFPLPDDVPFAAGAAVGIPYATAYDGLYDRGRAKPGETVFIHGASGAVGIAAIQLAHASGLTIIGSAGTDRGRTLVLEQGAHHAIDHTKEGYLEEVREFTNGEGPNLILEMLANVNLENDLNLVARYGRIIIIGNRGTIEINPRAAMMKDVDILGLALWNYPAEAMRSCHLALIAGLENGSLKPVVGRKLPLAEAGQAHVAVLEPGAYGKIVLIP